MAKTLKTGDVKRYALNNGKTFVTNSTRWAVICADAANDLFGFTSRDFARDDARILRDQGFMARIARIIKRTPKYVFVEVSK
jgi:hypothetical protein